MHHFGATLASLGEGSAFGLTEQGLRPISGALRRHSAFGLQRIKCRFAAWKPGLASLASKSRFATWKTWTLAAARGREALLASLADAVLAPLA